MNKKVLLALTLLSAMLLPAVATAAVIVNNNISVQTTFTNVNQVYLQEGPQYASAHSAGFITLKGNNQKFTNATINLAGVPGSSGAVYITNAIEIYSAMSKGPVDIWLNTTSSLSGVSIYEGSSLATFTGTSLSGANQILSGSNSFEFTLTNTPGVVAYISFELSGTSSFSGTLSLQYALA